MRFKEYMANQHQPHTQGSMNPRDYYPELRPFNQAKPGMMQISMMKEEIDTLKKIRKLAMNIVTAIQMDMPDKNRYAGVRMEGTFVDGMIYGVSLHDIQTGEGGRQFLSSEEIYWATNAGIFEETNQHDDKGSPLWNINLREMTRRLETAQYTINQMGSGMDLLKIGIDKVASGAYKGRLSPITNIIQ